MTRAPDDAKPDPAAQPAAETENAAPVAPPVSEDTPVRLAILECCAAAGPGRSIDPAVVARALGGAPEEVVAWRALLRRVRAATAALQDEGLVVALRKGKPVDIRSAKGVLRLALAPGGGGSGRGSGAG